MKAIDREKLLSIVEKRRAVVSVHEHFGEESVRHTNGAIITYKQSIADYEAIWNQRAIALVASWTNVIGAMFIPMPIYEIPHRHYVATEIWSYGDIYEERNRLLFRACEIAQDVFLKQNMGLLPLPVLLVDPRQPSDVMQKRYADIWPYVCGLKWHPYAQNTQLEEYVNQGYLDLAARNSLPTIVHCARPNTYGGAEDIKNTLGVRIVELGVALDIAHAGYLNADVLQAQENNPFFIDVCPWNMICDFACPKKTPLERIQALADIVARLPKQIVFGLDTPWSEIVWPDGRQFGAKPTIDLEFICLALDQQGIDGRYQLMYENGFAFACGKPASSYKLADL